MGTTTTLLPTTLIGLAAAFAAPAAAQIPESFQNLQVLPADIPRDELEATMEGFADQLGVRCSFCHMPQRYELDDKARKRTARRMIRLVAYLRESADSYFETGTDPARVTCWTCHRGEPAPAEYVPPE